MMAVMFVSCRGEIEDGITQTAAINQVAASETATNLPTTSVIVVPTAAETTEPSPMPKASPLPTILATASPLPTILPTASPLPAISLSVPPDWQPQAKLALEAFSIEPRSEVIVLTTDSSADMRLVAEESAFLVRRDPLALAVPYTMDWQDIGVVEAGQVIAEGHHVISLMPWSDMPANMRALRVGGLRIDDEQYPFQQAWSLEAGPGFENVAENFLPYLRASTVDEVVHVAAVGDIMLDRSLGSALENGYLEYPFAKTSEMLSQADLTIGNLESAMGTIGEPASKRYPFRAPPQAAEALAMAGFDIISLANNHAGDYGDEALLQAMELLRAQEIAAIGAGQDALEAHSAHIRKVNGLDIAFLSYVHVPIEASTGFDTASWTASEEKAGLAWAEPEAIRTDVSAVADDVDLVVVALHSGYEYQAPPSEPQMAAARAAIDAGADLVIGHHAHILQGIEFYEDGVIIYGTGNFAFEIDGPPETALFDIWLDRDGVRQIEISPAIIQFGGQPRLAESWEAPQILSRVYHLTKILNAK